MTLFVAKRKNGPLQVSMSIVMRNFKRLRRSRRPIALMATPSSDGHQKKELIGNFYRDGKLYTQETVLTFDHDFPSLADGV